MRERGISIAFSTTSCETANRNSCSCHPACSSSFLIYRKFPIPLLLICLLKSSHGILGIIETILLWLYYMNYMIISYIALHNPSSQRLVNFCVQDCQRVSIVTFRAESVATMEKGYTAILQPHFYMTWLNIQQVDVGKRDWDLWTTYFGHITDKNYVAVQALNSHLNTEQKWHSEFLK